MFAVGLGSRFLSYSPCPILVFSFGSIYCYPPVRDEFDGQWLPLHVGGRKKVVQHRSFNEKKNLSYGMRFYCFVDSRVGLLRFSLWSIKHLIFEDLAARSIVFSFCSSNGLTGSFDLLKMPLSKYAPGLTHLIPSLHKLEIVYEPLSSSGGHNCLGIVDYILSGRLHELARKRPDLEIAVIRKSATHPRVVGYYANRTASIILLNKLISEEVEDKIHFLCNSKDGLYRDTKSGVHITRPEGLEDRSSLRAWDPISTNYPWKP